MEKQIVYFGDASSIYNIHLLNKMKNYKQYDATIYDITDSILKYKKFARFEKKIFNRLDTFIALNKVKKNISKSFNIKGRKNRIAHVQFVSIFHFFLLLIYKMRFAKLILSFWGSDLLRQKKIILKLMFPLFLCANKITFETEEMRDIFLNIFPIFAKSDKLAYAIFGLDILDDIDNVSEEEILEFRNKYKIGNCKNNIVIGYNRRKEQQHISVVNSLNSLSIKHSVKIIIPWTYGEHDKAYEHSLISHLEQNQLDYIFLTEKMTDREVACLRKITDFFIHVQTTDSLSASMLETLYAKNSVITGAWLPYDYLFSNGIQMTLVDTPEEVCKSLEALILDENRKLINSRNSEIVGNISKWDACINYWLSLYK